MTRDFEELLGLLKRHGVRAVVVGAHALAHHAKPRYTKDIDILIEPTEENARVLLRALEEFGFGGTGIEVSDLTTPGGVSFDEVWSGRVEANVLGHQFDVIGREALIRNKRASSRPQDLADLEWLEGDHHGDE